MTSNLGSDYIRARMATLTETNRQTVVEETRNKVMELLKQKMRPEFLNRIDETIMFLPLTKNEIAQVVTLQLNQLQKMLAQNEITIQWTDNAVALIADRGYDPEFGARPVKRALQQLVLNPLSKAILAGEVSSEKPIKIDAENGEIKFES